MNKIIIGMFLSLLLSGCGSEDNSTDPGEENNFQPELRAVDTLNMVDINGKPISGASVSISALAPAALSIDNTPSSRSEENTAITVLTDEFGQIDVEDLPAGTYEITLIIDEVEVTFSFKITDSNSQAESTLAAPIIISEDNEGQTVISDISDQGIIFTISGVIYDTDGPIEGVQIEVSGGDSTNGSIAATTTDEDGTYLLIINTSIDNFDALLSASVRIYKQGYESIIESNIDAVNVSAISGFNIQLSPIDAANNVVYSENFDQTSSGGVCGTWQPTSIDGEEINLWHEHTSGLEIQNQAFVQGLVLLAPDDASQGYIPNPKSGRACWYGEGNSESVTQGNFLVELFVNAEAADNNNDLLDGGSSEDRNAGAIQSNNIDLSNETAPLSLHFRTWWEIESVNPNENGYDRMKIQYQEVEGEWTDLARLNPFTDPISADGVNREPMPFSNGGFNQAPFWQWQEPIPLDELAGKIVKLRFVFETVDASYNGFRGWLVDDLTIERSLGTFPLYTGCNDEDDYNEDEDEEFIAEASCNPEFETPQ